MGLHPFAAPRCLHTSGKLGEDLLIDRKHLKVEGRTASRHTGWQRQLCNLSLINLLLNCSSGKQSIYITRFLLARTPNSSHGLSICRSLAQSTWERRGKRNGRNSPRRTVCWVPSAIVEHQMICTNQVQTNSTSLRWQQKHSYKLMRCNADEGVEAKGKA